MRMTHGNGAGEELRDVTHDLSGADAMSVDFRGLGTDAVRKLGDIPFRATWSGDDGWDRIVTTSTQGTVPLPGHPGTALYINPGLRRLCAVIDEGAQGLWEKIILAGSQQLVDKLLVESPGFEELYNSPQSDILLKPNTASAFANINDSPDGSSGKEGNEPGLQLVCFDSIDGKTDTLAAEDVVRGAERRLDPNGLLVIGGTLHSCVGRQSLVNTVSVALGLFEPVYEQERPLEGGVVFYSVFSK